MVQFGFDQGRLIEIAAQTDAVDAFLLKESKTGCNEKSARAKIRSTKTVAGRTPYLAAIPARTLFWWLSPKEQCQSRFRVSSPCHVRLITDISVLFCSHHPEQAFSQMPWSFPFGF